MTVCRAWGGLLQEFCERGTPRENGLRELRNLFMDGPGESEQSGCFDVRFEESICIGERELDYAEPVIGTVRFLLDLETGDLVLEAVRSLQGEQEER